jgi:hypothetical protein
VSGVYRRRFHPARRRGAVFGPAAAPPPAVAVPLALRGRANWRAHRREAFQAVPRLDRLLFFGVAAAAPAVSVMVIVI